MSNFDLKNCPFCGCSAFVSLFNYPDGSSAYSVVCMHDDNCYLTMPLKQTLKLKVKLLTHGIIVI